MIFEELNFLARRSFSSIADIQDYKSKIENKLPELKGMQESLWRKHKNSNETDKPDILKEIESLTEKINMIKAHKKACIRTIDNYERIKEDYEKELKSQQNLQKNIINDRHRKLKQLEH